MEVNRKALKSLNAANSRRRPRAFSSCFTIIRNCGEASYESGIPLGVLVMEVNMMARRWSSLSRRGVRSSPDDPFLLRTQGGISVHLLPPLKGGRILTCIGV